MGRGRETEPERREPIRLRLALTSLSREDMTYRKGMTGLRRRSFVEVIEVHVVRLDFDSRTVLGKVGILLVPGRSVTKSHGSR